MCRNLCLFGTEAPHGSPFCRAVAATTSIGTAAAACRSRTAPACWVLWMDVLRRIHWICAVYPLTYCNYAVEQKRRGDVHLLLQRGQCIPCMVQS